MLSAMDRYRLANRALWDEWTAINARAETFYRLDEFRGVRIRDYEIEEVGPVTGKDLLHLQCHLGIDTLSRARLGARVTGDIPQWAGVVARFLRPGGIFYITEVHPVAAPPFASRRSSTCKVKPIRMSPSSCRSGSRPRRVTRSRTPL